MWHAIQAEEQPFQSRLRINHTYIYIYIFFITKYETILLLVVEFCLR